VWTRRTTVCSVLMELNMSVIIANVIVCYLQYHKAGSYWVPHWLTYQRGMACQYHGNSCCGTRWRVMHFCGILLLSIRCGITHNLQERRYACSGDTRLCSDHHRNSSKNDVECVLTCIGTPIPDFKSCNINTLSANCYCWVL